MKKIYFLLITFITTAFTFGQNIAVNGGFESWTGGVVDSWTSESGTTLTQETTIVAEGSSAALAHDRAECLLRPGGARRPAGGMPRAGIGDAGPLPPAWFRRLLSAPAFRRHAPTRGAGAHAGDRAGRHPAGRAVLGARRADEDHHPAQFRRHHRAGKHHHASHHS